MSGGNDHSKDKMFEIAEQLKKDYKRSVDTLLRLFDLWLSKEYTDDEFKEMHARLLVKIANIQGKLLQLLT